MSNNMETTMKHYYEQQAGEIMAELKKEYPVIVREALLYRLISLSNTIKLIEEDEKIQE